MQTPKTIHFTSDARLKLSRQTPPAQPATRAGDDDEQKVTLTGYPIVWNTLSTDRFDKDGKPYKVRLLPSSATFTSPCRALYEHEAPRLIGTTVNATLRIMPADDFGIPVEIQLPNTTTGRDVAELVEDKYLTGMSFAMQNGFEDATFVIENGQRVLNARKYTVDEVTVCSDPAFVTATVALKDPTAEDQAEAAEGQPEFSQTKKESDDTTPKLILSRLYLLRL